MIAPVFTSLRPKQWTKNLILFAALLFSEKGLLFSGQAWLFTIAGFFTFCGLSGSVYLLNDLADLEKDRLHPIKCQRPIPSGELSVGEAKGALIIILIISLLAAWNLSPLFFSLSLAYFMLNLAYSFKLKNLVILDVMCIAIGFVLRATAGVGALKSLEPGIYISHWLLLSTLMLAMFLGLAKRRQEIANYHDDAVKHRKILAQYSLSYIDQMTSILAATAIVTYTFYTVSPETIAKFGSDKMIYTVPMVIYGILRYLYLIHIQELGENPSEVVLSDRPLQLCVVIWAAVGVLVIHSARFL
ncbi:MAG TPA: decaprenyl-phosphate phosphoribosyltransferase [Candidatus Ozemobacteraceae bacterium]|nr:decaprenyl-phosphate phosphoribosyltransferase [Candidatus Ozemobacteraceae bacterium]